nr:unnamed protein product [Callosobruchus analis]
MLVACLLLLLRIFQSARSQDDSLRSAIEAIDRRTRDLEDYEDNDYGYTLNSPDGVAFLKGYTLERPYDFGRPDNNYLDEGYDADANNKRISSSFRERVEQDNEKQLEELVHLISSMDDKGKFSDEDYEDIIRHLWTSYRKPYVKSFRSPRTDKRYYYSQFGLDNGRMAKRNPFNDDNFEIPYNRHSEDDFEDVDDEDYSSNTLRKRFDRTDYKIKKLRAMYSNNPYYKLKRFSITKRSNGAVGSADGENISNRDLMLKSKQTLKCRKS